MMMMMMMRFGRYMSKSTNLHVLPPHLAFELDSTLLKSLCSILQSVCDSFLEDGMVSVCVNWNQDETASDCSHKHKKARTCCVFQISKLLVTLQHFLHVVAHDANHLCCP